MNGIKNILFDLGGVLVDLDRMACVHAFENLGFTNVKDFLGDYGQKGAFKELEEGKISKEEFFERIRTHIPQATDTEIAKAFQQFIQGLPVYKLKMLRDLKRRGYRVMLLSNNNPVVFPYICEQYFRQEGMTVKDYLDDIYLSYELQLLKPDTKIFQTLIERSGINPEETLFIDDSQDNLDVARYLGFETYLAPQNTDFSAIFNL